jgi:hypothetical protein
LATFGDLFNNPSMSSGCQTPENSASRLATARADRGSAVQNNSGRLDQPVGQFRLATLFQIPVGYEDEAGFHCGEPRVQETLPAVPPENNLRRREQF